MPSSIDPNKNSGRGRPRVDSDQIGIRFPVETIREIDDWRRKQPDLPIRTEAVRRLVGLGLAHENVEREPSQASAASVVADAWAALLSDPSLDSDGAPVPGREILAAYPLPPGAASDALAWLESHLLREFEKLSREMARKTKSTKRG